MSAFDPQIVERCCETLFGHLGLANTAIKVAVTHYAGIGKLNISSNCTLRDFERFMKLLQCFVRSMQVDIAAPPVEVYIPSASEPTIPTHESVSSDSTHAASTRDPQRRNYQTYYAARTPLTPGGLTPMQLLSKTGASAATAPNTSTNVSTCSTTMPACLLLFKTVDSLLTSVLTLVLQEGSSRSINVGTTEGGNIPLFPVDPSEFTRALLDDFAEGCGGDVGSLSSLMDSSHYRLSIELVSTIRDAVSGNKGMEPQWGMKICHVSQSPEMAFLASIFNKNEASWAKNITHQHQQPHSDTVVIWNTNDDENGNPKASLVYCISHSEWAATIVNRAANCPSVFTQRHSVVSPTQHERIYIFNPLTLRAENAFNTYMVPHLQLRRLMAGHCLTAVVRFALHPITCDCGASFSQRYLLLDSSSVINKCDAQSIWKLLISHSNKCIDSAVRYQPHSLLQIVLSIVNDVAAQQQIKSDAVESGPGFSSAFCAFVEECEETDRIPLTTGLIQLLVNNRF